MSTPAATVSNSNFVQGSLYETSVYTERARPLPNALTIHIPHLHLIVSTWGVTRSTAPMSSTQAVAACGEYIDRINNGDLTYDENEYRRIQDEVNQRVRVAVQLPAEIVEEIDTLVGPGENLNAHIGPNGARIVELSGRLFRTIKAELLAIPNVSAIDAARVSINKFLQEKV